MIWLPLVFLCHYEYIINNMTDSAKKTLTVLVAVLALGTLFWFAYRSQQTGILPTEEEALVPEATPVSDAVGFPDQNEAPIPTTSPDTADDMAMLTSQTWTWVRTQMNDGSEVTPNTPGIFTATFQDDGTISLGTDCNSMSGMFSLPAVGQIAFAPMATTLMFCEDSQESEFSQMLTDSTGYMFQDGKLVLLIKFDSGSVIFE